MKNNLLSRMIHPNRLALCLCGCLVGLLTLIWAGWYSAPAQANPSTIAPHSIITDTIWTVDKSPYQIDSFIVINLGATLTIEAGVTVENYYGPLQSTSYNFDVEGRIIANGTEVDPILFNPGPDGWSGLNIYGTSDAINTGSVLNYVVFEEGGFTGSGTAANLRLQYSQVEVHHCQFNNSPGDGLLGDDATAGGVADIYDSSFTNNAGYAVNFENGSVNPFLSNLTATGNGPSLPYGGNLVMVNDATLSPGQHIWENMGLPYLIRGTNVGPGSELDIEPGVHILAEPGNDALDVQGGILGAFGTPSQPIRFDPADAASGWSGIAIMGTEGYPSSGGWFDHVIITKGGFGGNCDLYVTYGNSSVTNSQLESSEDSGVCLDHGATLVMTGTHLINNQEYAMDVIDAGARFTLESLTASGNLSDTIGVEGGIITGMQIWPKSGINTYDLFYGGVTISTTAILNIEPGVTVLFGETRDITIRGTMNAIGTPANPITFTGETSTPGLWAGLNFVGTPERHAMGRLAYATIEYGGYGGSPLVGIENADVIFYHCILRHSASDAIRIYPGARISMPAEVTAAQQVQVNWSQFIDNSGYAIANQNADTLVNAIYNWWDGSSGPLAPDNPGGTGGEISGLVLYRPFVTGPSGSFVYLPLTKK